jgi:EAL domain-containing protein (putative c-di-GMP-specific phosphodiesterase class I)/GGDEF domain-containing protein
VTLGPHRLLGFAFASADLLMEISPTGVIAVALGASEALSGAPETALVGRPWRDFLDPQDRPMAQAMLDGLVEGQRAGPVILRLAQGADGVARAASLSAFRLPQNDGAISCTLSRARPPKVSGRNGLHDRASFEAVTSALFETAQSTGLDLELALIEMNGLAKARRGASPDAAQALEQRLAGALRAQSHGGQAAAELGGDRFAMVRPRGESPEVLVTRLTRLLALDPKDGVAPAAQAIALSGEASAGQLVRAIRYSLDNFIRDGLQGGSPATLSDAISRSVRRTLVEVGALGEAVNEGRFKLVFQPVVNLKANAALHHYEVLVRFGDNASPFPMIRMAEELDLIEPLDLAVFSQSVARLKADPGLKLAVNISGRTIASGEFVQNVRKVLKGAPEVRGRLLFELTESAAIDDLPLADRHLQALRAEGCEICLDDFGAGAASLAYLQQLSLDIVKIDGRYIRELQHGGRESTFIRHLVTMCGELGVRTLAEMVETSQVEDAVRRAGVDLAQGWLYGAAADQPQPPKGQPAAAAARRLGARETWG